MALTPAQRKALKARAHPLHPLVIIGDKGLTPAVLKEIDVHLKSHELIKVRIAAGERDDRETMSQSICETLDAQPVQHIGKIIVVYREKPPEPQVRNPRPSRATTALKAKMARRRTAEERGQSRRPPGRRPGNEAKFDAEPARRRASYADKDAQPARRRSSTEDKDAQPARRRSSTEDSDATPPRRRFGAERSERPPPRKRRGADLDMDAKPARRRAGPGRPSTAPRKRASAERGAAAAPARGRARSR